MSIRSIVYATVNVPSVTALAPGGVKAGSSLTGPVVARPWVVYRVQSVTPTLFGDDTDQSSDQSVEFWVYDDPGSYTRIEAVIEELQKLMGSNPSMRVRWNGVGPELSDDEQKAALRVTSFTCKEIGP